MVPATRKRTPVTFYLIVLLTARFTTSYIYSEESLNLVMQYTSAAIPKRVTSIPIFDFGPHFLVNESYPKESPVLM